jgi:ribosomal protein S18 acetylase RimI-like enzyme
VVDTPSEYVRVCRLEEVHSICEVLRETHLLTTADTAEAFQKKLKHDGESIQVLCHDGSIVGVVVVVYDPWASFIWHLAVRPGYQKRGFGKMLIKSAEDMILQRGGSLTCAYVLEGNTVSRKTFRTSGYSEFPMPIIPVEKTL